MTKFALLLMITLASAILWVVTGINMQITGQSYLDLTAPWWHIALHVLWFLSALATSMVGVSAWLNWRSRGKLTHNPPQQT